jgi:hypothetical protein
VPKDRVLRDSGVGLHTVAAALAAGPPAGDSIYEIRDYEFDSLG